MKLVLIGLGIFFFAFPAVAGTFMDTFDDGETGRVAGTCPVE